MMLMQCFCVFLFCFSDFSYESICFGYSFELHQQVGNQNGYHNICLYKYVDKKYTSCNLKTTELVNCALFGLCAVIRWIMVSFEYPRV